MENSTDNQETRTGEGKGRIRSIIPRFLAMALVLSMVGALPVYYNNSDRKCRID
jgi:hypothetical protein